MKLLLYIYFPLAFVAEFLSKELELIPKKATYVLDLFPVAFLLYILVRFALIKKVIIPYRYLILLLLYIIVLIIGLFINGTTPLRVIIGIRYYLKYFPLFFLPFVYIFEESELKAQLYAILTFILLQTPIALFQRIVTYSGVQTGDVITGTTGSSTTLTILVLFSLSFLFALVLNRRIKIKKYIALSLFVFIPATINETKITFVLLPFIFIFTSYLMEGINLSQKIKIMVSSVLIVAIAISIFVPVYDHFMRPRTGFGIMDFFFQDNNKLSRYIYRGSDEPQSIRRGDALALSFKKQSKDLGRFLFGLGMANVVESGIAKMSFREKQRLDYGPEMLLLTNFLWELGLIGFIIHLFFFIFIFSDSIKLKKQKNLFGVLGLSWCTITATMIICFIYTNYLRINLISMIFWYFSGIAASHSYLHKNTENEQYV